MSFIRRLLNWLRYGGITRYSPGDTFETHECILCKRDRDASYCIPEPKGNAPCCDNETRGWPGGCTNCGDPCL